MMETPDIVVGFLVCPGEGKVLLHHRGPDNDPDPNCWGAIGGHLEPIDGGDPRQALIRELQEELEFEGDAHTLHEIHQAAFAPGRRVTIFVVTAERTDQRFEVHEGLEVCWFTIAEAWDLPTLCDVTRADLPRIVNWLDTAGS